MIVPFSLAVARSVPQKLSVKHESCELCASRTDEDTVSSLLYIVTLTFPFSLSGQARTHSSRSYDTVTSPNEFTQVSIESRRERLVKL